jgi:hypothetical protein
LVIAMVDLRMREIWREKFPSKNFRPTTKDESTAKPHVGGGRRLLYWTCDIGVTLLDVHIIIDDDTLALSSTPHR